MQGRGPSLCLKLLPNTSLGHHCLDTLSHLVPCCCLDFTKQPGFLSCFEPGSYCSPGWLGVYYVAKVRLEFLILPAVSWGLGLWSGNTALLSRFNLYTGKEGNSRFSFQGKFIENKEGRVQCIWPREDLTWRWLYVKSQRSTNTGWETFKGSTWHRSVRSWTQEDCHSPSWDEGNFTQCF